MDIGCGDLELSVSVKKWGSYKYDDDVYDTSTVCRFILDII